MRRNFALKDLIGDTPAWQDLAQCQQADPEAWYPEKGSPTKGAVRVCNRCPVRTECLEFALETQEPHGIWGGKTEQERRTLLRRGGLAVAA
jgi:WhiB family redox-sensing transcriptional regulator